MQRKTTDFTSPKHRQDIIFFRNAPYKRPSNLNRLKKSHTTDCIESEPTAVPAEKVIALSPNKRYLKLNTSLGKGTFKTVFKGIDVLEQREVAWNSIRVDYKKEATLSEILLLKRLKHPNIIKLNDSWMSPKEIVFITEYMPTGTLSQYLQSIKEPLSLKTIKNWSTQILKAISYLHSQNPPIIHRDIKNDNIFLNLKLNKLKIGDLGVAKSYIKTKYQLVGTPEYISPEVYQLQFYSPKSDIYAFGLSLLHLTTREYPYSELKTSIQIYQTVLQGILPLAIRKVPDSCLKNLILKCIVNYNDRLTAEECLNHHFYTDTYTNVFLLKGCIGDCNISDVPYKAPVLSNDTSTALSIFGATSQTAVFQIFFKEKNYFLKCLFDIHKDRVECIVADMVAEGVVEEEKGLEIIRMMYAGLEKCRLRNDNGRIQSGIIEVIGSSIKFTGVRQVPIDYINNKDICRDCGEGKKNICKDCDKNISNIHDIDNPYNQSDDGPVFVEFIDMHGNTVNNETDFMLEDFYYSYRECEFKNGIVKDAVLECHKINKIKLEEILELYDLNVVVMTKKFKRKEKYKELELKNKVLPVNLLFKMDKCIDLDHICNEKCQHNVPSDISSSSEEEEEEIEPLYVRVVRNCKFDEDMVVYIESDDSYFEAGVYGGRVSKYKVDKGNSGCKGSRDSTVVKPPLDNNTNNNTPLTTNIDNNHPLNISTDNNTHLTSSTDNSTPLTITSHNSTPLITNTDNSTPSSNNPCSVDNLENNSSVCYNCNNTNIKDKDSHKDNDNSNVGSIAHPSSNTTSPNKAIKDTFDGKRGLKSDEESDIGGRYFEDGCSIDDFVYETAVLAKRDVEVSVGWCKLLKNNDLECVGDLRILCDEDWDKLGLTVFASRQMKNMLYGRDKHPVREKFLCVNMDFKDYCDECCISNFIEEVVCYVNKKGLKNQWEEKLLGQDLRSVGELKGLAENDWENLGLSVYGVRVLKNMVFKKGKVYKGN